MPMIDDAATEPFLQDSFYNGSLPSTKSKMPSNKEIKKFLKDPSYKGSISGINFRELALSARNNKRNQEKMGPLKAQEDRKFTEGTRLKTAATRSSVLKTTGWGATFVCAFIDPIIFPALSFGVAVLANIWERSFNNEANQLLNDARKARRKLFSFSEKNEKHKKLKFLASKYAQQFKLAKEIRLRDLPEVIKVKIATGECQSARLGKRIDFLTKEERATVARVKRDYYRAQSKAQADKMREKVTNDINNLDYDRTLLIREFAEGHRSAIATSSLFLLGHKDGDRAFAISVANKLGFLTPSKDMNMEQRYNMACDIKGTRAKLRRLAGSRMPKPDICNFIHALARAASLT